MRRALALVTCAALALAGCASLPTSSAPTTFDVSARDGSGIQFSAEAVDDSGVEVTIAFDGEEADAASLLEIMTLGAKHGDVVTLSTEDDGAGEVLDSLVALLSRDLDQE